MLKTILEFRKGILFVRLIGELSKYTTKQLQLEVTDIMIQNGIQNVVFNLEQLQNIDMKGMNILLYHYEICKKQNGKCYICNIIDEQIYQKLKKHRILNYLQEMDNELVVLHQIKELEESV